MTTYTAVHQWMWPPYRDAMLATCKIDLFEIDNSTVNRGFTRSTNMGIAKMREDDTDWLVFVSSSLRFGPPGGLDFIEYLDNWHGLVCEAAGVFGWHLIAFRREAIETVGLWDPNFHPYGYDDIDWSTRFQIAYSIDETKQWEGIPIWEKVEVDVTDVMMGHSIKLAGGGGEPGQEQQLRSYFHAKWGHWPGEPQDGRRYDHPFNDPSKPVSWFPIPEGYEIP